MKKNAVLLLIVFILLGCTTVTRYRMEKTPVQKHKRIPEFSSAIDVNYKKADKTVFGSSDENVIGILGFSDNGRDIKKISAEIYNELTGFPGYRFISYEELKSHYELSRISTNNSKLLSDLKKDFQIRYIVMGKIYNPSDNSMKIYIMDLNSFKTIFEFSCKNSNSSTAVQDVIKFFKTNEIPQYEHVQVRTGYRDSIYTVYEDRQIPYQKKQLDLVKVLGAIILGAAIAFFVTKS